MYATTYYPSHCVQSSKDEHESSFQQNMLKCIVFSNVLLDLCYMQFLSEHFGALHENLVLNEISHLKTVNETEQSVVPNLKNCVFYKQKDVL